MALVVYGTIGPEGHQSIGSIGAPNEDVVTDDQDEVNDVVEASRDP